MLVPLCLCLALSGAHPDSLSRTRIHVEGARVSVELRFQALSLLEVLPELERVADGQLDAEEAEAGRAAVAAYLLERLTFFQGEQRLAGTLDLLTPEDPGTLSPFELQNVVARLSFRAATELQTLRVESRLFHETNPWHKDFASLAWNDEAEVQHAFEGSATSWLFEPAHVRRPGVVALFLRLGIEHILHGFDHQAFLLALLVASRRARSLIGVVTAFTLAHSLTLAAAALGWVEVPARFVELAIALSIAYVACDNLLRRGTRTPWFEAFFFGLLHGLGFAGFLGDALAGEPLILSALLGFNLGVELGQLALVAACLLLILVSFRAQRSRPSDDPRAGLVPPAVRTLVSALVALAGFYWFVERAGWLSWS